MNETYPFQPAPLTSPPHHNAQIGPTIYNPPPAQLTPLHRPPLFLSEFAFIVGGGSGGGGTHGRVQTCRRACGLSV